MQKLIDESMIDMCEEEGVSRELVFFAFLWCWLSKHRLLENY